MAVQPITINKSGHYCPGEGPVSMVIVIGFLIVGGCVIGGYMLAHGTLAVLLQPAELIIIGGSALGALVIGTPGHIIKKILSSIKVALAGKGKDQNIQMNILWVLYELQELGYL